MNIAFFGIGLMGRLMVQRLMSAGHRFFLFNRTVSRIKDLEATGAVISASPAEAFAPMLRVLGTSLRRVGEVGQAAALKLGLSSETRVFKFLK